MSAHEHSNGERLRTDSFSQQVTAHYNRQAYSAEEYLRLCDASYTYYTQALNLRAHNRSSSGEDRKMSPLMDTLSQQHDVVSGNFDAILSQTEASMLDGRSLAFLYISNTTIDATRAAVQDRQRKESILFDRYSHVEFYHSIESMAERLTSSVERTAVRIALDAIIWNDAKDRMINNQHITGRKAINDDVIKYASSQDTAAMMLCALDAVVFNSINTRQKPGSHWIVRQNHFSTDTVKKFAHTALDKDIWHEVQDLLNLGVTRQTCNVTINRASCDAAKQAMRVEMAATKDNVRQQKNSSYIFDDMSVLRGMKSVLNDSLFETQRNAFFKDKIHKPYSLLGDKDISSKYKDLMGDIFKHQRNAPSQPIDAQGAPKIDTTTTSKPKEAQKPKVSDFVTEAEVERIVMTCTRANRRLTWLAGVDVRPVVANVIGTIRYLRQETTARGEVFTDKDAYMRYRRAVEVVESNQDPEKTKKDNLKFQIVSALMGESIKGRLPF